jgi:putative protein-disulfide isomerase
MQDSLNCDDNGFCESETDKTNGKVEKRTDIESQGTILYFGDPMCSWCWGISNEVTALIKQFEGTLDFEMIMGGLRPNGGDEWNDEFKTMLKRHWEHVNMASGQEFNYGLFDKDDFDYNTEPPSRAVVVIKFIYPEKAFDFLKAVSRKFYVDNEDPTHDTFYESICADLDIDYASFRVLFHSQKFKHETFKEFTSAKDHGVHGFPTVLLEHKGRYTVLTRGYNSADRLAERIDYVLDKSKKKEESKRSIND